MREKLIRFMMGRYGMDQLSNCLLWTGMIVIILNMFFRSPILSLIGTAAMIYGYVRIFSKDYAKRSAQNRWFLDKTAFIRYKFGELKNKFKSGRGNSSSSPTHTIFMCKKCHQKIRVPSGKGKIEITCPKCQYRFIKRS